MLTRLLGMSKYKLRRNKIKQIAKQYSLKFNFQEHDYHY